MGKQIKITKEEYEEVKEAIKKNRQKATSNSIKI